MRGMRHETRQGQGTHSSRALPLSRDVGSKGIHDCSVSNWWASWRLDQIVAYDFRPMAASEQNGDLQLSKQGISSRL